MTTKRSRTVSLTLLASLGAALTACGQPTPMYERLSYVDYNACYNDYRLIPDLVTPCVQSSGVWYGPYTYGTGNVHYLGYSPVGDLLTFGVVYNLATRQSSRYEEPRAQTIVQSVVSRPKTAAGASGAVGAAGGGTTTQPRVNLNKSPVSPADTARSGTVSRGGFGSSSRSSGSFGG